MSTGVRIASIMLVVIVALMQSALAWRMAILGAAPNVVIVIVASVALLTGPINGALCGFVAGTSLALFSALALGPHALLATLIGYGIGRVGEQLITDDHPAPPILATVFASAAMALGRPLVEFLLDPAAHRVDGIWQYTLVSTACAAILAVPVYLLVRSVLRAASAVELPSREVDA